eukprot:TRINITY_DN10169_c0_g3_i1.p1 TRINITY_DN10169_c0_g3~~TRINITY_DN10169_c0_g3_i1.p1  ORF type:complete len:1093 (+),score=203.23 TRINITY_DN10169_c0_g3_i1:105-3383(+)
MSGIEVLAALGLVGNELFSYNRESYEFDQDQRFMREELRLNMQIERFKLFREDIRDLVELTVGKMDLYHLVGAFFCKMCVIYYCEGIIHGEVPPYLLVLYYLSASCGFAFLILAVCLAMHASITSHSYGTRLLCRAVRLPIPSAGQMSVMNARYADFEKTGREMLRIPFFSKDNHWQPRTQEQEHAEQQGGLGFGLRQVMNGGAAAEGGLRGRSNTADSREGRPEGLLGDGSAALQEEAELVQAVDFRTERHVELFRKLQGKWQCFDAYARVCMALGMRQLLQGITYYMIGVTMVENKSATVALGVIIVLQAACVFVFMLDVYQTLGCCNNFDIQVMGTMPTFTAFLAILTSLPSTETSHQRAMWEYNLSYWMTVPCFLCEVVWFELLVHVSKPTQDEIGMPRYWRSVLFMDVFSETADPLEMDIDTGLRKLSAEEKSVVHRVAVQAIAQLQQAQAAVRRWQAVPLVMKSQAQIDRIDKCAKGLRDWASLLASELYRRKLTDLDVKMDICPWGELSREARDEDPLAGYVCGPLEHYVGAGMRGLFYYDVENDEERHEEQISGWNVLSIVELRVTCKLFEESVDKVLRAGRNPVDEMMEPGSFEPTMRELSQEMQRTRSGEQSEEDGFSRQQSLSSTGSSLSHGTIERRVTSRWLALRGAQKKKSQLRVSPVRLPWTLLSIVTRAVQLVWVFALVVHTLEAATCITTWDFVKDPSGKKKVTEEEQHVVDYFNYRRLLPSRWLGMEEQDSTSLMAQEVQVEWTYGAFFQPGGLACGLGVASSDAADQPDRKPWLMVSSRAAYYWAAAVQERGTEALRLHAHRLRDVAATTGVACPSSDLRTNAHCWLLLADGGKVSVQALRQDGSMDSSEGSTRMEFHSPQPTSSVMMITGAVIPCPRPAARRDNNTSQTASCLLLATSAGFDAVVQVSVAELPAHGQAAKPLKALCKLHALLPRGSTADEVAALHLDAESMRLVAISRSRRVVAWTLDGLQPKRLGDWQLELPFNLAAADDVSGSTGICSVADGRMFVVGRCAQCYGQPAPWLLRTRLFKTAALPAHSPMSAQADIVVSKGALVRDNATVTSDGLTGRSVTSL